jgi:alkanesulfonate monooxygenase SsuD/methylene tetrahydromethanopterin reductase-like flavin-dependent oxidoreductase (luciferase family)
MRELWTKGESSFSGKHFQLDGALCYPLPPQEGGIPIWVAGGGEKKTLRTAAKYASYTNFDGSPEGFAHKSQVLAAHCKDVGTDFDRITRSADYNVIVGETEKDVQDKLEWVRAHLSPHVPEKELESTVRLFSSGPLVGTPEQIVERLQGMEKLGMTYAISYFLDAAYDRSSLDLFSTKVIPELLSAS